MAKYYTGNIMMCLDYKKDNKEDNFNNSVVYVENAFLYKLDSGKFFYIEDGPESFLIEYIPLIPKEKLESHGDSYETEPKYSFDMYVDEKSLKSYLIRDKDNNPVK